MASTTLMTVEQYLHFPAERDGTELVGGEVVVEQATLRHQRIQRRLITALAAWCEAAPGRGEASLPIDVLVSEHDVYGPDLVYYREDRIPADEDRPYPLPDLVAEIRSPGTWRYDIGRKKAMYEAAGLPELWLVDDVAEVVLVYRRSSPDATEFDVALELARDEELTSPLLPGFSVALARIFA